MAEKSGVAKRREDIRLQHFAAEDLWTGEGEKGWFSVPRSLPLVLALLSSKEISKKHDPSFVYLELLSRQRGEGVIEMAHEEEHAFAAGYVGTRAVRTWQERMKILEENGFIRTLQVGIQRYRYVAIVHPTTAVQMLRDQKRVDENWWNAYLANKRESKEPTSEQRQKKIASAKKVVSMPSAVKKKATAKAATR
jgi:hypothetical protein